MTTGILVLIGLFLATLWALWQETRKGDQNKEARQALKELLDNQIGKGKALLQRLALGESEDEAYREYDSWKDETHRVLSESLGKPTADKCLRPPEHGSSYQGSRMGLIGYHTNNLNALLADKRQWEIRDEFIERLRG